MQNHRLFRAVAILLIICLTGIILKYGRPFMVPLAFASLLAMLLVPIADWLQRKGVGKALAALLSIMVLVAFIAGVITFIGMQASDIAKNANKIEQRAKEKYHQAQEFVSTKLGIPKEKQEEIIKQQQQSSKTQMTGIAASIASGVGGFLTTTLIVFVYIFLLIYFREHLRRFILRIVPAKDEENAAEVLEKSRIVTQKYLTGLSTMIAGLWIMYSIGFSIAGVQNAVFFAILCGLLEIIPFVGNLVGTSLTVLMALAQGGGTGVVLGVLITYALVQFIQSYILEPLVVGNEVNINPLFTIVGLVAGEFVWGIPGMILAIPALAVTKIVCDHVEALKPYGRLIGEEKKDESGLKKSLKRLGKKVIDTFRGGQDRH